MISKNKKRIYISLSKEALEILEYNADAGLCTKSDIIENYIKAIGKSGDKSERIFIKYIKKDGAFK